MSFRKPKKPVRPRVVMLNADSDEDEMDDTPAPVLLPPKSTNNGSTDVTKKKSKTSSDFEEKSIKIKPATLLSFTDDVEGDGEEEVFKIKKSSVSRRLMKQREREKKESTRPKTSIKTEPGESNAKKLTSQIEGFTEQIKIKKEPKEVKKEKKDFMRVLNGREAEAVDMESDDEVNDAADSRHKFKRPGAGGGAAIQDAVRRALEQGQIPDANLIHEARKRKQMAREMGTEFIPVENVDR